MDDDDDDDDDLPAPAFLFPQSKRCQAARLSLALGARPVTRVLGDVLLSKGEGASDPSLRWANVARRSVCCEGAHAGL